MDEYQSMDVYSLLDPMFYSSLLKNKTYQNTKSNIKNEKCYYISTPRPEDRVIINGQLVTWDCPIGYFCPNKRDKFKCSPGFFCPENSAQPVYCCEGYYCSENAKNIFLCPEGSFCTAGTTDPISCNFLANCPPGSIKPNKFMVSVLVLIFIIVIFIFFHYKKLTDNSDKVKYYESLRRLDLVLEIDNGGTPRRNTYVRDPRRFLEKNRYFLWALRNGREEIQPRKSLARGARTFDIDIEFENLTLELPNGNLALKGVSGEFRHGRTCAVMGPSGSGKSTLLSLLTGKIAKKSGVVKKNDTVGSLKKYKKLIGFVPQEDIMLRELTVREILVHSALMRLPSNMALEDKRLKVMEVISFLKLDGVMDCKIGNEEQRGISGGERKRVNIGMELVAEPSVLFLDEPTSGLDSNMSLEICSMLKYIAEKQNITVVAVIHSPSQQVLNTFDDILLLNNKGQSIYFGDTKSVIRNFNNRSPSIRDLDESPADFILKIASGRVNTRAPTCETPPQSRSTFLRAIRAFFCQNDRIRNTPNAIYAFKLLYERAYSQTYKCRIRFLSDQLLHLFCGVFVSFAITNSEYLGRTPKEICLITPYVLKSSCLIPFDLIQDVGAFVTLGVTFAGISAGCTTFGYEMVVYWRDTSAGMKTIPYFLAKVIIDIPRILIAALMFTLSLIVFYPFQVVYHELYLIILLNYTSAWMMGYFISIVTPKEKFGLVGTGIALAWGLVLSGESPKLEEVDSNDSYKPLKWLWDISAQRWTVEALYLRELSSRLWDEIKNEELRHTYSFDDYPKCR
ncbi:9270_t:CDS:10 [Dentiscutata erythropus]|uniref:9270_t:CDS:1 n=1 Tax=Dentiscutata erythropus TaxID=1348616 RepID=A0A9N9EIF9_9GLOM|nr:9270_t:CDS:10 [Dentiscutata erythropus]